MDKDKLQNFCDYLESDYGHDIAEEVRSSKKLDATSPTFDSDALSLLHEILSTRSTVKTYCGPTTSTTHIEDLI